MHRVLRVLFPLLLLGLLATMIAGAFGAFGDPATSTQVIELAESGREVIVVDNGRPFGFFFPGFFLLFFLLLFSFKAFAFRRWARHGHDHTGGPGFAGRGHLSGPWKDHLDDWHRAQHSGAESNPPPADVV